VALLLVFATAVTVVGLVEQPLIAKSDWAKTREAKQNENRNGIRKLSQFFGGLFQDFPSLEIFLVEIVFDIIRNLLTIEKTP
jgi:hypothetical protein